MIKEENAYLLNSSTFFVADMVITFGRYGLFVWPMWLWPIWYRPDLLFLGTKVPGSESYIKLYFKIGG